MWSLNNSDDTRILVRNSITNIIDGIFRHIKTFSQVLIIINHVHIYIYIISINGILVLCSIFLSIVHIHVIMTIMVVIIIIAILITFETILGNYRTCSVIVVAIWCLTCIQVFGLPNLGLDECVQRMALHKCSMLYFNA